MITGRLFKSESVEFEFNVPVEQAVQNLGSRVAAPGKPPHGVGDSMVGAVTQGTTYIYRAVPGSRNSFRPTFYGSFSDHSGKTILAGVITLNRVIQKFVVLWCAVVALVAVWTLITILNNPAASWGSLAYVVFMLIACIVFFRMMIQKSSPDISWLKQEIRQSDSDRQRA